MTNIFMNSIIIMVLQVAVGLILSSMVGYGLAKYRFKGRNTIFVLVLMVMMVPVEILILPLYKQINAKSAGTKVFSLRM